MDIKDIIKWLFQAAKPKTQTNSKSRFKTQFFVALSLVALQTVFCGQCCGASSLEYAKDNLNERTVFREFEIGKFVDQSGGKSVFSNAENKTFGGKSVAKNGLFYKNKYVVKLMRDVNSYLDGLLEKNAGADSARTFGRPIQKLQQALLPIMFKLGVVSTLVVLTFLLTVKAVALLKMLLMFKVASVLSKIGGGFHGGHGHQQPWSPQKDIHIHIHNGGGHVESHSVQDHGYYPGPTSHDIWHRGDSNSASSAHSPSVANYNSRPVANPGPVSINTPYGHYVRTGGPTAPSYRK